MIKIYVYSHSFKARHQKRNRDGRFAKTLLTARQVEKNPLVRFYYPSSKTGVNTWRTVRLISATPYYMVGLEVIREDNKLRYQYKKFCSPKVGDFSLLEFNPKGMS